MDRWKVYFVGLASVFADVSTTWLGLKYPEIKEMNPLANPFLEAGTILGGQALILHLGERMKVDPKVTVAVGLVPSVVPFLAAANNLARIAIVHARRYPWETCPLLYSEK